MLSRGHRDDDHHVRVASADLGLGQRRRATQTCPAQPNASGQVVGAVAKTDPPLAKSSPANTNTQQPLDRRRGI